MNQKKFMTLLISFFLISAFFLLKKHNLPPFSKKKNFLNIVLIGPAGSGKGTQAKLIQDEFGLFQLSAGDALREERQDPNGQYTKTINEFIDKGLLVPSEITNNIVAKKINKEIKNNKSINGFLFDGYPRSMSQVYPLDSALKNHGQKIDLAIHIDVDFEVLYERLSGRFSCKKCGAIYHKKYTPTKVENKCDKCGHHEFSVRADDVDKDAIKSRFDIFLNETKEVLNEYSKRGIVFKVNGNQSPELIKNEIREKITSILNE